MADNRFKIYNDIHVPISLKYYYYEGWGINDLDFIDRLLHGYNAYSKSAFSLYFENTPHYNKYFKSELKVVVGEKYLSKENYCFIANKDKMEKVVISYYEDGCWHLCKKDEYIKVREWIKSTMNGLWKCDEWLIDCKITYILHNSLEG